MCVLLRIQLLPLLLLLLALWVLRLARFGMWRRLNLRKR